MLVAHGKRLKLELPAAARRADHDAGTDMRRRFKRSQRLEYKELYGKAAKYLAQSPTFDPETPGMLFRIKALNPVIAADDSVSIILSIDLPPKPNVFPDTVRAALSVIYNDSATEPERAGVRWLLLGGGASVRPRGRAPSQSHYILRTGPHGRYTGRIQLQS